jgi:stage II sporulation protein D
MLSVAYQDGNMVLTAYSINSSNEITAKEEIGRTQSSVTIQALSDPIYIRSLKRSNGYKPTYFGSFEIYIKDSSLRLINEVALDTYLKNVVPGQMVPSGGMEAYRAQAVASRTSAVYHILQGGHSSEGYHITDAGEAQLYNNQPSCTARCSQ